MALSYLVPHFILGFLLRIIVTTLMKDPTKTNGPPAEEMHLNARLGFQRPKKIKNYYRMIKPSRQDFLTNSFRPSMANYFVHEMYGFVGFQTRSKFLKKGHILMQASWWWVGMKQIGVKKVSNCLRWVADM